MTKKTSRERKEEHYFNRAVIAIDDGAVERDAVRLARLPLAIFQYRLAQRGESKKHARTWVTQTTDAAMESTRCKNSKGKARRAERLEKEADVAQRAAEAVERTRAQRSRLQKKALDFRVHHYTAAKIFRRALLVRRQIARKRTCARRTAIFKKTAQEVALSEISN